MTKRGGPGPRPPRRCIFCGRGGLSGEHIWPDWASPLLPDSSSMERGVSTQVGKAQIVTSERVRSRQGGTKKVKVRAVCAPCNRTWMSRIEMSAKDLLTCLIHGYGITLLPAGQQALAEWVTLKMMVAEQDVPALAAFSQIDRENFYERRTIPPGLSVVLYHCGEGTWRSAYQRRAATMLPIGQVPPAGFDPNEKNLSTVTFGIGELLIFGLYARTPGLFGLFDIPTATRLVPPQDRAVWPPPMRLTAAGAEHVARQMDDVIRSPKVVEGRWPT